jgi:uncharacterized membrane protein
MVVGSRAVVFDVLHAIGIAVLVTQDTLAIGVRVACIPNAIAAGVEPCTTSSARSGQEVAGFSTCGGPTGLLVC